MFLPKNKYKVKFTSDGLVDGNGKRYIGQYIETNDGQVFSGSDPLTTKSKLVPIESTFNSRLEIPSLPGNLYILPTPQDYLKGFFDRYFIQEKRTKKIVEVTSKIYKTINNDKLIKVTLKWTLVGYREDTEIKGYKVKSVITQNTLSVEQASTTVPELKVHITDMLQFVKLL